MRRKRDVVAPRKPAVRGCDRNSGDSHWSWGDCPLDSARRKSSPDAVRARLLIRPTRHAFKDKTVSAGFSGSLSRGVRHARATSTRKDPGQPATCRLPATRLSEWVPGAPDGDASTTKLPLFASPIRRDNRCFSTRQYRPGREGGHPRQIAASSVCAADKRTICAQPRPPTSTSPNLSTVDHRVRYSSCSTSRGCAPEAFVVRSRMNGPGIVQQRAGRLGGCHVPCIETRVKTEAFLIESFDELD